MPRDWTSYFVGEVLMKLHTKYMVLFYVNTSLKK